MASLYLSTRAARLRAALGNSPLLSRLAMLFLVLGGAALWLLHGILGADLPAPAMKLQAAGLSGPLSIVRDPHGVPDIQAHSDDDAFYGVGLVHAQDRLWQLELQRRMIHGQLAEAFGRPAVGQDIWFRTLNLHAAAQTAWPSLSPAAQRSLTRYVDGLNAGIAAQTHLPAEFTLLGLQPQRWTVYDSLAWIKMFALNLGGNARVEAVRYVASQALSPSQLHAFFPAYPDAAPTTVAPGAADGFTRFFAFQKSLERELALGGRAVGSNAWAVAGRHTGGGALLANDPHLGLQIPSPWYALRARAETEALDVAGMSLVGVPFVIFGHNRHISWGGTNMMADAQDLYLERTDPGDPTRYQAPGGWEQFTTREERIAIRTPAPAILHEPVAPLRVTLRATRNGPVISDDELRVFEQPVSLRWVALDRGDTSYEAFYRLQYARDWAGFRQALAFHVAPAMNIVYADRAGNIGYLGAGRIPVRAAGHGALPAPGWNGSHAWTGYVPAHEMPQSYNPPSGFIVSANNRVAGAEYPHFISNDWAPPTRAARITRLLEQAIAGGNKINAADIRRIQGDLVDESAQRLASRLLANFDPINVDEREAVRLLRAWDGNMAGDSAAAAIFNVWSDHLRARLFRDRLRWYWNRPSQSAYLNELVERVENDTLGQIVGGTDATWCAGDCAPMLHASLRSALAAIRRLGGGADMAGWRWDALQHAAYVHTPFSAIKPLDYLFARKLAGGGSRNTVNVSASTFVDKEGYVQNAGPSFRQVISFADGAPQLELMNSTGQSGNLASAHYADMLRQLRDGHYVRLPASPASEAAP